MSTATEVINVLIPAAQKALIDSAAQLLGKSRTAFSLELAVRHAEDVLAEKTHFQLSSEQWDAFTQALDTPVRPDPALVQLLNIPAPWDKEHEDFRALSSGSASPSGVLLLRRAPAGCLTQNTSPRK